MQCFEVTIKVSKYITCLPLCVSVIKRIVHPAAFALIGSTLVNMSKTTFSCSVFYQQLQETIDQIPKKDILFVQGDWNAKVGKGAQADWGEVCGPYCNVETNERGLRLL